MGCAPSSPAAAQPSEAATRRGEAAGQAPAEGGEARAPPPPGAGGKAGREAAGARGDGAAGATPPREQRGAVDVALAVADDGTASVTLTPVAAAPPPPPSEQRGAVDVALAVADDGTTSVTLTPVAAAPPAAMPNEEPQPSCTWRVIAVNDVYELGNLPRLKTAISELRTENTTVVLAGDFLAPSLLSSLDYGHGMVDVLNDLGLEYVCIGNHEQDVPHKHLLKRMDESKFTWINTNAPHLPLEGRPALPPFAVVEAKSADGTHARRVGILGLNTDDKGLYRPTSYFATHMQPILPAAREWRAKLLESHGVDLVVPMTHQVMPLDREMAEECGVDFPIIIGGHDHQPYLETVNGSIITKQGADASLIGVIDITWPTADAPGGKPSIDVRQLPASDYASEPTSEALVEKHRRVLKALDEAKLCMTPGGVVLNSKRIRLEQTTMGTLVCSALRDALFADCAIINAGNIRGNTTYESDKNSITYSDLKSEIPFESKVVVLEMPGKVISEVVAFTRQFALQDPPVEKGMFAQLDDCMAWDASTNTVTRCRNAPMDLEKMYKVAVLYQVAFEGIDGVTPLVDYVNARRDEDEAMPCHDDSARGAKDLLVEHFGRAVWWSIIKEAGFQEIDKDSSGTISQDELTEALVTRYGSDMGELVVRNLMSLADANGDGYIDRHELLSVCFLSATMFYSHDVDGSGHLDREETMNVIIETVGGSEQEVASMVDDIFERLDTDGSGTVTMGELKQYAEMRQTSVTI